MMPTLVPLVTIAPGAIENLLDRAFGADRHARTAYRLREGASPVDALSFALTEGGRLLALLQSWPVALVDDESGATHPLILVGPVAVVPEAQHQGHGRRLLNALITRLEASRAPAQVMIGDHEYYGRFGFDAGATREWRVLAGPVDQHRLLARQASGLPRRAALVAAGVSQLAPEIAID